MVSNRMAEKPYTVREVDQMINGLTTRLDNRLNDQDKVLSRIEIQTTKTNGHLRVHDRLIWLVTGGLGIIGWLYATNFISCLGVICPKR